MMMMMINRLFTCNRNRCSLLHELSMFLVFLSLQAVDAVEEMVAVAGMLGERNLSRRGLCDVWKQERFDGFRISGSSALNWTYQCHYQTR